MDRTIWNESIRAWVAVHESTAACGRSTRSTRRRVSRGLLALHIAACICRPPERESMSGAIAPTARIDRRETT
ncbi:ESPR domain-containing protein [Burkholderia cepacia]|uniref:ESPR-type extended signal peptide-containing protein n=1 Tax=Burkholderia cepacia TaxID=292 RepID=UPI0011D206F1